MNALKNVTGWINVKHFKNVILEVLNEYNHQEYLSWKDGDWIYSAEGQVEMISYVKNIYPDLLVSIS